MKKKLGFVGLLVGSIALAGCDETSLRPLKAKIPTGSMPEVESVDAATPASGEADPGTVTTGDSSYGGGHSEEESEDPATFRYFGRATVVRGVVGDVLSGLVQATDNGSILGLLGGHALIDITLADTGELGRDGERIERNLGAVVIAGIANVQLLHAELEGKDGKTHAEAKLATAGVMLDDTELSGLLALPTVFAGVIKAKATAECEGKQPKLWGRAEFDDIKVLGRAVEIIGDEPKVIEVQLPLVRDALVKITFNKIKKTVSGSAVGGSIGKVEVIGAQIEVPLLDTNVTLGRAVAGIVCQ